MIDVLTLAVPPEHEKRSPKFFRVALLDNAGVLYLPARLAGSEFAVALAANFDGQPMLRRRGKLYVPAFWLAKEFPKCRDCCNSYIDLHADDMLAKVAPPEWFSSPSY